MKSMKILESVRIVGGGVKSLLPRTLFVFVLAYLKASYMDIRGVLSIFRKRDAEILIMDFFAAMKGYITNGPQRG